jgi:tRNA U34 5-carboxymethylaminomethyl modifying enzyme MnmG/GidA
MPFYELAPPTETISEEMKQQVEIAIRYEGYIEKQEKEVANFREMEQIKIPSDFSYEDIPDYRTNCGKSYRPFSPHLWGRPAGWKA